MDSQETINAMALGRIFAFSSAALLQLYKEAGSATTIINHRHDIRQVWPDASAKMAEMLSTADAVINRAAEEYEWDTSHDVKPLVYGDNAYPTRLAQCEDAPLVLYYKGTANLNCMRTIAIVGTRHCTAYGQDLIRRFVADMHALCPDTLVMSGLAYGVDICAHRNTLEQGMDTVAVLAHGLDTLYPSSHRDVANRMVAQGGLVTEHFTHTKPDKVNFVKRNRIVAGMADACLLVESAEKGGGLITAGIARSYNREVFAFPGRVGDMYSAGCNNLIRNNGAALITSAADFVEAMGWQEDNVLAKARTQGIERSLFGNLTEEQQRVANALKKENNQQANILAMHTGLSIQQIASVLFEMEMKGVVKLYAGGVYHLL